MARLSYALIPFALLAAVGCSSKSSGNTPDAPIITTTDAPPPIDGMPDALVCQAPTMNCSGACVNTTVDEQNCGSCGNVCKGGAFCDPTVGSGTCGCPMPANFLGTDVTASGLLAIVQQISAQLHLTVEIGGTSGTTGLNGLLILVNPTSAGTQPGQDYTLSDPTGGGIPTPPIVGALYGISISSMSADASYIATSGTVNFDIITCVPSGAGQGSELKGTLTNVTFAGVKGDLLGGQAQIDPNGCTFTVPKLTFDIKSTSPCTP